MRLEDFVPLPIRKIVRGLFHAARKRSHYSPIANTKEAFERFYAQDAVIARDYLSPTRRDIYKSVAEYCAEKLMTSNVVGTVRAVDIGCGTGHMLEVLRRKLIPNYDLELFGLDFANTAIIKAKKILPAATFVVEDIYENSLPSDFFDLVLNIETLEHLHWPEKALRELLRICKPGGNIVVTVPNGEKDSWEGHVNFWSISQFAELLSPYGLVDIKLLKNDTVIMARLVKPTSDVK